MSSIHRSCQKDQEGVGEVEQHPDVGWIIDVHRSLGSSAEHYVVPEDELLGDDHSVVTGPIATPLVKSTENTFKIVPMYLIYIYNI